MLEQVAHCGRYFRADLVKAVHVAVALLIKPSKSHRIHLRLLVDGHAVVAIVDLYLLLYHCQLYPGCGFKNLSNEIRLMVFVGLFQNICYRGLVLPRLQMNPVKLSF